MERTPQNSPEVKDDQKEDLILTPLPKESSRATAEESSKLTPEEALLIVDTLRDKKEVHLEIGTARALHQMGLIDYMEIGKFHELQQTINRRKEIEEELSKLGDSNAPGQIAAAKTVVEKLEENASALFSSRGPLISPSEQKEIDTVSGQVERLEAKRVVLSIKLLTTQKKSQFIDGFVEAGEVAVKLLDKKRV